VRARLPNRRPSITCEIDFGGRRFAVTAGIAVADAGRTLTLGEVFANGATSGDAKEGQDLISIINDASVLASMALQYGAPPAALAKSMGRLPSAPVMPADLDRSDGGAPAREPASIIGAIVDLLVELEAEMAGEHAA